MESPASRASRAALRLRFAQNDSVIHEISWFLAFPLSRDSKALVSGHRRDDNSPMECPFNSSKTPAYYGSYLAVDKLLDLQIPLSLIEGKLHAHDEMLFIIIHQTYELWFKQILHELQACCEVLQQPSADDNGPDMNVVVHRLRRIVEIWKLLNHQVDVLETMTPLDFLDFRSSLEGASGFQSTQFRQIEATLGLRMENRFRPDYYKHTELGGFSADDYKVIVEAEKTTTLLKLVEQWLARMPFFHDSFWAHWDDHSAGKTENSEGKFWDQYRILYEASLSERDERPDLLGKFDETFFKTGAGDFSPASLRAALFIMLYRDEPLFRLPFALLNTLIEIDEQLGNFRYRHLQMVRRMIGTRIGTGGSSGEQYLQGAVNKNYIFKELASVITFLIERRSLPQLPARLHHALRFSSTEP
ncbi:MAG: tryptophan 2,3-dioxygenase [Verrucomicrobiota bacterium]|jgi:tryptophan 2,3-dioxygenase